jgi:tyrosine-protein kinase Etk/Wzc
MMKYSTQEPYLPQLSGPLPGAVQEDGYRSGLSPILGVIYDNRWLILCIAMVVTLVGMAYATIAKPVYVADLLIHVEEETNANGSQNILGEMASMFDVKSSATSEMELLRSRLVMLRAVDALHLYIDARPKYFPIIGRTIAQRSDSLSTPGLFGMGGYAWGGENIVVSVFNVPDANMNQRFVLTADGNNRYRVAQLGVAREWRGQVGTPLVVSTGAGEIELLVEKLHANSGAQFYLQRAPRLSTAEDVQKSLTIVELGKQSGVIRASLKGENPQRVSATLNEIGREYMLQNRARKTEEAEKSLSFLQTEMPHLKRELEQAEAKYTQFRNSHGTIDLGEEARISLQQSAAAKTKRLELQQRRTELLTRFTDEHPSLVGINAQIREMSSEIASAEGHIRALPTLEQELLGLNRDIKVNSDLYTALLNTAQQLSLITAGKVSNVRLVDAPMTPGRSKKPASTIVLFSAALGMFLGLASAFIKKALYGAIDDPYQIEKMCGVPVYATIPHSKRLKKLHAKTSAKSTRLPLLANVSSTDVAIESLRSFRTALQYSMSRAKNNVVVMTGPTLGLGKTFVSVNLAAIFATAGKRVLLVDADLRNGHLNKYFNVARQGGLSEYIAGELSVDQVIHRGVMDSMDFISTGSLPPNPSELLLRPRFEELFQSLSAEYDLILVDSTPVLAVSDSLTIGAHAGAIYLVTRAGVTTAEEVTESMKRLRQSGLSVKGVLFNDLPPRPGRYGYPYGDPEAAPNLKVKAGIPLVGAPVSSQ